MRHSNVLVFVILVATTGCGRLPDRPVAADEGDLQAVADLLAEFDRCAREQDLETFLSYSTEDVVSLAPDQPAIVGKDAMREVYRGLYDAFEMQMTHHPVETHVYGDILIHRGNGTGTMTPKGGGDPIVFDNKYIFILVRAPDGSLKVWRAAFNANAPPAPAT